MFDQPIVRKPVTTQRIGKKADEEKLPEQLIVPPISKVEGADPITATPVESLAGLTKLPMAGAVSIAAGELLDVLIAHPGLFGVTCVVLSGYPEAQYEPEWERACWNLERVAYAELVAELVTSERIDNAMKEQAGSRQKPERRQQTLERERTRHFDGFDAHGANGKPSGEAEEELLGDE